MPPPPHPHLTLIAPGETAVLSFLFGSSFPVRWYDGGGSGDVVRRAIAHLLLAAQGWRCTQPNTVGWGVDIDKAGEDG